MMLLFLCKINLLSCIITHSSENSTTLIKELPDTERVDRRSI